MRHAVDGEREEREKLARYRKALYKTARAHGVIARQDFAVFENNGYQGLYHETAANGFHVALANELLATQLVAGKIAWHSWQARKLSAPHVLQRPRPQTVTSHACWPFTARS